MLNNIVRWSIERRWLVVLISLAISIWGFWVLGHMPLDVFPDFAPPQVEIQVDAEGLAPEEVESLVTKPIESTINGTPGLTSLRSSSATGIASVKAVFGWNIDIYRARQLVTERLQRVNNLLPKGVKQPEILPINSPLGWTIKYAFTSKDGDMMELWRTINWDVRNRLLSVPGVSNVFLYGGDERQYQVLVDPDRLKSYNISLTDLNKAVQGSNSNAPGGFATTPDREFLIKGLGRLESIEQLKKSVIKANKGIPILLEQVATVQIGPGLRRGDGIFQGKRAVILTVTKQPTGDTPTVVKAIEAAMAEIQPGLPAGVSFTKTFDQNLFIEASVKNVEEVLRDGAIIVSVILIVFLLNWRTVVISLSALPVSLLLGTLILSWTGQSINTMTLGGFVVAIGSVVDDAIVDMENVYRRLRENQVAANPKSPFEVVFAGSVEVRVSVLFSTIIIAVVFAPIFVLSGVEGRIFAPMGLTYLLSILASTLVALTLTPALCALLLVGSPLPSVKTPIERWAQEIYRPLLKLAMQMPKVILGISLAGFIAAMVILPGLGKVFLPEFQDRSLVNTLTLFPGQSLEATNQSAIAVMDALKNDKRFDSLQFRSGFASGDPDVGGVNFGELDVQISAEGSIDRERTISVLRQELEKLPGVASSVGGFISHRMDEILSGVRSAIAVKIYGPELDQLRNLGKQVKTSMASIPGVTDLQLEPQIPVKQIQVKFDREAAGRYGLTIGDLAETIETGFSGRTVSQILEKQQTFNLVVRLPDSFRQNPESIGNFLIDTPTGQKIPLSQVANIEYGTGPSTINRDNVSRLIVVSANISGRDLGAVIADVRANVQKISLPSGYYVQFGGQFQAQEQATQTLLLSGAAALILISVLIYFAVKSIGGTVMILLNLPLALIGGVGSIAMSGGVISVASMVGFITLFGVATRNGLLLVENYHQRLAVGTPLKETIVEGAMERFVAILLTALSSALGMVPIIIGAGAGKEILQPLAIVVLGGLFTSTALTLLVIPALYTQFGQRLIKHPKPNRA